MTRGLVRLRALRDLVHDGHRCMPGDVLLVPADSARRLVAWGDAELTEQAKQALGVERQQ